MSSTLEFSVLKQFEIGATSSGGGSTGAQSSGWLVYESNAWVGDSVDSASQRMRFQNTYFSNTLGLTGGGGGVSTFPTTNSNSILASNLYYHNINAKGFTFYNANSAFTDTVWIGGSIVSGQHSPIYGVGVHYPGKWNLYPAQSISLANFDVSTVRPY
jgi:hypothetical protein